jgi:hypothetical protein
VEAGRVAAAKSAQRPEGRVRFAALDAPTAEFVSDLTLLAPGLLDPFVLGINCGDAMAKTVIGLMENLHAAQAVVRELIESGIAREDVGFMANEKHAEPPASATEAATQSASDAIAGAGTGAALGGAAGLALALVPLAIPGIGPMLAAGAIATAIAGAGIGAVAGGLIGALTGLGVPEEEAHYYAEAMRRGGILVTVAADNKTKAELAVAIMRRHGAIDIEQRAAEWKKQGWKGRFDADAMHEAGYGARIYPKPAKRARNRAPKGGAPA